MNVKNVTKFLADELIYDNKEIFSQLLLPTKWFTGDLSVYNKISNFLSLGAFHDGSGGNQNCSAKDNYLMAPTTSSGIESSDKFSNMFLLSDCSRKQVEKFLK